MPMVGCDVGNAVVIPTYLFVLYSTSANILTAAINKLIATASTIARIERFPLGGIGGGGISYCWLVVSYGLIYGLAGMVGSNGGLYFVGSNIQSPPNWCDIILMPS